MLTIGTMSGTSMDGIDVALIETDGSSDITELGNVSISYQPEFKILLKSAEYAVRACAGDLGRARAYYPAALRVYLQNELGVLKDDIDNKLAALSAYLHDEKNVDRPLMLDEVIQHSATLHGLTIKKLLQVTGYDAAQVDVVGYHGQTLFHHPAIGVTTQVGDGQALAEQVGITVVNDFRSRDVAQGGQGAPFAPLYHLALAIRDNKLPVAVVNCGGISNITLIRNKNELALIGFDTGPGNALIDRLVTQRTQGKETMDTDGQYGKAGTVNLQLLSTLYQKAMIKDGQNYFQIKPPKSLDYGDMALIPELHSASLSLADACRTLEAFTADSIVRSLELVKAEIPKHWILTGGGWKNPVIRHELEERLSQRLAATQIQTANEAGWNSQALEAQIFAYLAVRSLQNRPISVPGTTRVPEPISGGRAYVPTAGATATVKKLMQENPHY